MKTVFISGATDGIGKQTALELLKLGHKVIIHGRSKEKCEQTAAYLSREADVKKLEYLVADLSSFDEIKLLSNELRNTDFDVLLNNAGVFENSKVILDNGLEKTFMINHMAVFALSFALMDKMKTTPGFRLINVSSMAQASSIDFNNLNGEKFYDAYNAYAVSKLCNILFTYRISDLLKDYDFSANCLHPGVISTKLLNAGWGAGGSSLENGAKTSVYLAVNDDVEGVSGKYFSALKQKKSVALSYDFKVQRSLWDISLEILNKFAFYKTHI